MPWIEIFNEAIAKFKSGQPIDHLLELINDQSKGEYLFHNLYDIGFIFDVSDTNFLFNLEDGEDNLDRIYNPLFFETFENFYEETEINFDNDLEVLKYLKDFFDEYGDVVISLDMYEYEGVILSCVTQVQGQGGPFSSNFKVFSCKEDCEKHYIDTGYLIYTWGGVTKSHSYDELLKMTKDYFKKKKK